MDRKTRPVAVPLAEPEADARPIKLHLHVGRSIAGSVPFIYVRTGGP